MPQTEKEKREAEIKRLKTTIRKAKERIAELKGNKGADDE